MDRSHTRGIDQIRRSSEAVGVSVLSFASTHALGSLSTAFVGPFSGGFEQSAQVTMLVLLVVIKAVTMQQRILAYRHWPQPIVKWAMQANFPSLGAQSIFRWLNLWTVTYGGDPAICRCTLDAIRLQGAQSIQASKIITVTDKACPEQNRRIRCEVRIQSRSCRCPGICVPA
jgi:hypothetical protein